MNKNQLRKMALAAEIIGGAAVVITLIFLVLETRDNTRAIQAQTYLTLTSEVNRIREGLFDSEVALIFALSVRDQAIPEEPGDAMAYQQIFESAFGVYEAAYYAWQKGVLGDAEWSRFDAAMCRNMGNAAIIWEPNPQLVFSSGIKGVLTAEFVEYAERRCDWATIIESMSE